MSADPSPYGDMPQSRSTASADTKHNQAAPTANGNSFKDAVVNSKVTGGAPVVLVCLQ